MMATVRQIRSRDHTASIRAVLTVLVIDLAMSISRDIGAGFIA